MFVLSWIVRYNATSLVSVDCAGVHVLCCVRAAIRVCVVVVCMCSWRLCMCLLCVRVVCLRVCVKSMSLLVWLCGWRLCCVMLCVSRVALDAHGHLFMMGLFVFFFNARACALLFSCPHAAV